MGRCKFKDCERKMICTSIINAGLNVAKKSGLNKLTLRSVAKEAGYCPANIYEYFADKDALLFAMSSKTCNDIYEHLRVLKQTSNPAADLVALLQSTIDFHLEQPVSVDLLTMVCFSQRLPAPIPEFEQAVRLFAELLKRLNSPKLKTKKQIEDALDVLRAIIVGSVQLLSQQIDSDRPKRTKTIATNALKALISGWNS